MKTLLLKFCCTLAALIALGSSVQAEITLPALFSDHMVIQAGAAVPIWGWAAAGETISVSTGPQSLTTQAQADGSWRVTLEKMPSGTVLAITCRAANTVTIQDALVGEVWLCSGQSNMEMPVKRARDAEREQAAARFPQLRVFKVERQTSLTPLARCAGHWVVCSPETAGDFSATAFYFGRELHTTQGMPIGLIVSAWSGSAIEAWTSREAQETQAPLRELLATWDSKDRAYTDEIAAREKDAYQRARAQWQASLRELRAAGKPAPKAPRPPRDPHTDWHHPAVLFNGMIAPLIPFSLRGAIWYQGESNALTDDSSALYARQLPLLIDDWRRRWGQGDFPFAWVQLPFISNKTVHWARMRESMRQTLSTPQTGMAVTIDLGEPRLLHPKNKQDFAHRLALWARANVYGAPLKWSGPLPAEHWTRGQEIVVRFQHAAGLRAQDGELRGFEIAGDDHRFLPAQARIEGELVIVSSPDVAQPAAARYSWSNLPDGNLINSADLPASPFRTDDW
ncbi:MAG TPA: sialate O-acetylesterase [Pirellulales bacterium]|nr:sialate O-acetylesterase [Pirellulales bacterium]